jgi:molecular chaperone DnaK (HSP70)
MIVGIDLGTTNSLVAVWHGGAARPIPNALYKLGVGVPRDRKRAAELCDKACASGDPRSCEDARKLAAAKKTRGTNASVR